MTISHQAKALQDAFREVTGRFGTQTHGEMAGGTSVLSHQSAMPDWPEGVPEPEVSWTIEDGKFITNITVAGQLVQFWPDREGWGVEDGSRFGAWKEVCGEKEQEAVEWGRAAHERMEQVLKSAIAEDPKASAAVTRAATGGLGAPEHKAPTGGPELDEEIDRLEDEARKAQTRLQHARMVKDIAAIREQCPNVAGFYLYPAWGLVAGDALDADGNEVSAEESEALSEIFRNYTEKDHKLFHDTRVEIQEVLDTF